MNSRSRARMSFLALVAALAFVACSDDDNPTDTNADTTPPGVSSVTAVDAAHVDVVFNEAVTRETAEDEGNYFIDLVFVPSSVTRGRSDSVAGGGLGVIVASLRSDGRTVTLTTNPMQDVDYGLEVMNIQDAHGNVITEPVQKDFAGSIDADNTPPLLVYRKPAPGATNVALGEIIELSFSEPVQGFTFGMGGPGPVDVQFTSDDQTHYIGTHDLLQKNTTYNLALSDVMDLSGNAMAAADVEWTFKTTNVDDVTPPTLVSSIPANLATHVNANTTLSLTFSEAIDPNYEPFFSPVINGTPEWSPDQKTITFTPEGPLAADQQYELWIFPGQVADLAGNPNTVLYTRVFTTGAALGSGSIAGTITGDANSSAANDPSGAFVGVADAFPFGGELFAVYGRTTVAGNNTYKANYLRDGSYYPMCIKDTVHDGLLDPSFGDAIGFYGIDFVNGDLSPDSVVVAGGSDVTGIHFKLYDPTAVWGQVDYKGVYGAEPHAVFVGLFVAAGFDPETSTPVVGTETSWPEMPRYVINSLEVDPIANGNYYIGAFLDANDSGDYEPAVDPVGLHGGLNTPTAVNLANGGDAPDRGILLLDPLPGANATAVHWTTTPHTAWLRNLSKAIREAQLTALK